MDDLIETLTYDVDESESLSCEVEEDDDDTVSLKSGRKRSGSDIEGLRKSSKSTKRQRVGGSRKERALTELNSVEVNLDSEVILEDDPVIISACNENRPSSAAANSHYNVSGAEASTTSGFESRSKSDDNDSEFINVRYRRVLKRIPQDIPYVPITCQDGTRLYLRLKEKPKEEEDSLITSDTKEKKHLVEEWSKIKSDARAIKDKFHSELRKTIARDNELGVNDSSNNKNDNDQGCLWVEKYKPKSFLDLLSQEAVNSALLHWVKLWDKSVFGNDYLAKVKENREKYARLEAQEKEKEERFGFQRKSYLPSNEEYDEGGRPNMKVALLAGDPGLGKTTCAHIIAKHAGYKVREVNASDDRSIEIFRKVLDDTTQSRSEIFQEGKPNCLIIDEIDGAPSASINVLIELMMGNATETGKRKLKKVLRRPVICICNDLYATSLKILRKHAFILQFPPVTIPRLADRLTEISDRERLFLDLNTIKLLCQKSECDIRSCLSTLQFIKRRKCSPNDAFLSQIGVADKSKGIFSVWSDIFSLPQEKRYQDAQLDPSKPGVRFRNILRTVQNFGEYEKLFGGIHQNYLNVKYRDSYMQSIIQGLEWATWFEEIREHIEKTQTYGTFGYLPMYFVMSHFLYGRRDLIKIQFPSVEMASRLPKYRNTIKTQISETSANAARFLDPHMLITDVFPAILNIIQPCNIRPVPSQIWTQRERDTLKNAVEVMLTYNLSYGQSKNPETGAYSFVLEPDIDELVSFKLQDSGTSKKVFPYAIKQLIAREIETEKLRRNDMVPDIVQKEVFKLPETPKANSKPKAMDFINKTPVSVARDFFGRPIIPTNVSPEADSSLKKGPTTVMYYRFKEGFSNAVRRYVKMRDLS